MRSKEKVQRIVFEILNILKEKKNQGAIGARRIAKELNNRGFEIGERAVRYHLKHLDEKGFTEKLGTLKGRKITEKGEEEVKKDLVGKRVGFMIGKIEELIYDMSYDLKTGKGTISANISLLDEEVTEEALEIMSEVMKAGFAPSSLVKVSEEGNRIGSLEVPSGKVGIATVCSVTIDGLLAKHSIPVTPKFGGVLEIKDGEPERFVDAIAYRGSSLDPLDVFASRKMTSFQDVLEKGTGRILANFREIPAAARETSIDIIKQSEKQDLDGVLRVGSPAESIFGLPVEVNRVGIVMVGGTNPGVAVQEKGIEIETKPLETLLDISEMYPIQEFI